MDLQSQSLGGLWNISVPNRAWILLFCVVLRLSIDLRLALLQLIVEARNERLQFQAQERGSQGQLGMKVRLTRKFSNILNGIDLSQAHTGDTLDLPARDAHMLVAEGWAELAELPVPDRASDRPPRGRKSRRSRKR